MNKQYNINLYGVLAFFSFVGAAFIYFLFTVGNISFLPAIVTIALLAILGLVCIFTLIKGKESPALERISKLIIFYFAITFIAGVAVAIQLGIATS